MCVLLNRDQTAANIVMIFWSQKSCGCCTCYHKLGAFGLQATPDKKLADGGWLESTSWHPRAGSSMPAGRRAGSLTCWLVDLRAGIDERTGKR